MEKNKYSRRNILVAMGAFSILPGIALAQEVEANTKWNNLIKRGLERDIIIIDPKAKSETFLYPQKINKRYEWNYNLTRVLIYHMRNASIESYVASNPGSPRFGNDGVITDLYIPPVYYHEFVDRIIKTRAVSRALNVRVVGNDVYFLNVHLHPLAALDKVPELLMKAAKLDKVQKGKLVIGLSKKLDPSHEKYVLLGAI